MKSIIRVSVVVAVVGMSMGVASNADARSCFLKKLFNRGGDCCQTSCCQPAPSCDCGCPAADCGCGTVVTEGNVVVEGNSGEPTVASPSDDLQAVPEAPDSEDTAEEAVEEAAGDAAEANTDGEA